MVYCESMFPQIQNFFIPFFTFMLEEFIIYNVFMSIKIGYPTKCMIYVIMCNEQILYA